MSTSALSWAPRSVPGRLRMSEVVTLEVANRWEAFADKALAGETLTRGEARTVLASRDDELLQLLGASFRVRSAAFGRKVKLNMLINAKSGICPEDCGYCSQSIVSTAPVAKYQLLSRETLVAGAREAWARQAGTYCIVASGRRPSARELREVTDAVREIKQELPLKICACLGLLSDEDATALKEAGVDRYNHNVNTSRDHHDRITTTHSYDDRVATVEAVKRAGISPCSGFIAGMGESDEQIVDVEAAPVSADPRPAALRLSDEGDPRGRWAGGQPRFAAAAGALPGERDLHRRL